MKNINVALQASTKIINILTESKEQLEKNIYEMDGVFAIINEKLELIEANDQFTDILEEYYFRNDFLNYIEKEFHNELNIQLKKVIQGESSVSVEVRLKNNRLYLLKISDYFVKRKEEGKILKINGVDITDMRDLESQIVDVLRTINLGVIFIDGNNQIMPGHSDYSKVILEKDELIGSDIHSVLFDIATNKFSDEEKDTISSLREVFGKDEIFFKVISFTLPAKFEIPSDLKEDGKRILQITLEPITVDGIVVKYMIIAQDVTDISNTKTVTFAEDVGAVASGVEKSPADMKDCINDLKALVERLPEEINDKASDETKGVLHSIKGLLGMNGLQFMAKLIHDTETYIKPENYENFKDVLEEKLIKFYECYGVICSLYDILNSDQASSNENSVSKKLISKFNKLSKELREHYFLSLKHLLDKVEMTEVNCFEDSMTKLVEKNAMTFETFSDINFNVENCVVATASSQAIKTSLIHMINNSFAHGFEPGSEENTIDIIGKRDQNYYVLKYKDTGRGVNIAKMREKLIESGEDASEVNSSSDLQIAECIFKAGISTKDEVSEIAGRGVGLAGVYNDIKILGGELSIDEFQKGTHFTLKVPVKTQMHVESQVIGADVLAYAIDLVLDLAEGEKVKVPKGAYFIKDIAMFYKALSELNELKLDSLKITKISSIEDQDEFLMINESFKENNCKISKNSDGVITLHLENTVDCSQSLEICSSLFANKETIEKSVKDCKEILGIHLEVIESEENLSFPIFSLLNKVVYPSLLRLIEAKLYAKIKGSKL